MKKKKLSRRTRQAIVRRKKREKLLKKLDTSAITDMDWIVIAAALIKMRDHSFDLGERARAEGLVDTALSMESHGVRANDILLRLKHPAAIGLESEMETES